MNTAYKYWLSQVLHEATFLGLETDVQLRRATAIFEVLILPEDTAAPSSRRIQLVFSTLGRIAVTRRLVTFKNVEEGFTEMSKGDAIPCTIATLDEMVCGLAGQPLYLDAFWEETLFDVDELVLKTWGDQVSLDWQAGPDGRKHSFFVFQEGGDEHLELVLWFDALEILSVDEQRIELLQLDRANDRWWQGLYANDPRTRGAGLYPM